jgi:hypothetical protein
MTYIFYKIRTGTEEPMNDHGGVGSWIFLYIKCMHILSESMSHSTGNTPFRPSLVPGTVYIYSIVEYVMRL